MENKICWIIRYSEIALKGKNRCDFEKKLVENIRKYLKKNNIKFEKIKRPPGRIIILSDKDCSILKNVFGITSISKSILCSQDIEDIKKIIKKHFIKNIKDNFRVTVKRLNKNLKINSMDLAKDIGAFIVEKTSKKVKLKESKYNLGIELIDKDTYIFDSKIGCFGGLPKGIQGKAYTLINDKKSILASWLMLKRGCNLIPVGFKDVKLDILNKYSLKEQKLKIIKNFDELNESDTLIVDDTLENIKDYEFKGLILRPIIAYSKKEIDDMLKLIS